VATLLPHLPQASLLTFHVAAVFGLVTVFVLAAVGLYPVALVTAAVLVPLLTVLYLWDVDVYEQESLLVLALTMAWGALSGVAVDALTRLVSTSGAGSVGAGHGSTVWLRGLLFPAVGVVVVLLGPMVLLPYRKFNDVLDGATFGAAAAVAFAGAQALAQGIRVLGGGLRPGGQAWPWIARLMTLAVAEPVLAAAAVGSAAGSLWLRYRAPVRDRTALGLAGRPSVAVPVGVVFVVLAAVAQVELNPGLALLVIALLALAAVSSLRRVLHLGLMEESAERDIGAVFVCANCGRDTPRHTFCAWCGISLRALPKGRSEGAER
jgi:hypothetical protein